MRFLLAILCPPLAVLFCGKIVQTPLSLILTLCLWVPGVIHAMAIVADHKANKRNDKLISAIHQGRSNSVRVEKWS